MSGDQWFESLRGDRVGSEWHFPAAARFAQSDLRSPIASQRNAFEQVTVSVWLEQMRWMWHDAWQTVLAFFGSDAHPPLRTRVRRRGS